QVLSAQLAVPSVTYPDDRAIASFHERMLERVAALPDVVAVGIVSRLPLSGDNQTGSIESESGNARPTNVQTRTASPDYFRTLRVSFKEGRSFARTDGDDAPPVAIIDERLAGMLWPGQSALGRRLRPWPGAPWSTVVGVVDHVRHTGLDGSADLPQIYWNY